MRPRTKNLALPSWLILTVAIVVYAGQASSASPALSSSSGLSAWVKPAPGHLIVGKAIALPPALFEAGAVGSESLVTPSQADGVARAMWQAWEFALVTSDTRALTQLEAPGKMLAGTINQCALPDGHCVYETAPRVSGELHTIVPLQQAYPLYFLAEIRTTEYVNAANGLVAYEPWVELQILTKASAEASWRLSFDTGYNGTNGVPALLPFDLTEAGPSDPAGGQELYNPAPLHAPPVPADQFLPLLGAYWQSYKDSGHAPTPSAFTRDGYTSGVGEQFAQSRQGSVYAGHRQNFRFSADATAGTWEFSAAGYPVRCGTVRDIATDTPLKIGLLYQNHDESNYGVPLRGGLYRRITTTAEHETCVYVGAGALDAVGNNIYSSVTGVFAKNAKKTKKSPALADLETDYGVLAYQLARYDKTLAVCQHSHPTNSCIKPFAEHAEQEFARFERRLTSNIFPAATQTQVEKIRATARHLTKLYQQFNAGATTAQTLTKIAAATIALNHEYTTLVRELS